MLRILVRQSYSWGRTKRFTSSYKEKSLKENWLADAGAYPIIAIMLVAMTLPAIAGGYMMAKSPDNRMMKANRKRLFRGDISDDDDEPWKDDDDMRD